MNRIIDWILVPLVLVGFMMTPAVFAQDTPKSLLVGVYDSEKGADEAYKEVKKLEDTKAVELEGFAIVSKDEKGKAHVYNTRQKDARWGAVIGGVIGALTMGPIGAVGGAAAGSGTGWLVGNATGISKESVKNLENALEPDTSALVAVVDNRWVAGLEKAIKAQATKTFVKEELETERINEAQSSQAKPGTAH
jgi:uncharacterized membrane protein